MKRECMVRLVNKGSHFVDPQGFLALDMDMKSWGQDF